MSAGVYEQIRDAIVRGRYAAGDALAEHTLALEYGISRTPIREALHRLELENLVERTGRGVRVRGSSPAEILDIYDARTILEGAAAKAAAVKGTELDHMQLRHAQSVMRHAGVDIAERADANRRFHEALWDASHSPTLIDLLTRLNTHTMRYPTTTLVVDDRWNEVIREHDELIELIVAGDAEGARLCAEHHVIGVRQVRLQMYAAGEDNLQLKRSVDPD